MRPSSWVAALACLAACAHSRAGKPDRSSRPQVPPVAAGHSSGIQVPEYADQLWVFEVHPAKPEAERQVGHYSRPGFLARFADMHRQACGRAVRLVVVAYAAAGGQVSDEITFNGRLGRSRLIYRGQVWEGVEIPC